MASEQCGCCKVCCYSTPYATIFALSVTVVGLVGFLSSAAYGVALMNNEPALQNHTVLFGSVMGGVVSTTVLPLVLATILAYCATGYVRDELYHPLVKAFVGRFCSVWVVLLTFGYFVVWLCLSLMLAMVMAVYLELRHGCSSITSPSGTNLSQYTLEKNDCHMFSAEESDVDLYVCGDLGNLCRAGVNVGLSLAISLGFSVLVVMGMVLILVVQAANFVSVKESDKRSYRPKGDY